MPRVRVESGAGETMSQKTKYAKIANPARAAVPLAVGLGLLLSLISSDSAQALAEDAPTAVQRGSTLPIYLQPETLAEAEKPTVELAEGSALWMPGPERFYGHALRDLRDHLQQMTGAQHPLAAAEPN